jgi:HEAT repeat protein
VLQHELAHVRRRDCAVQALAQLACALHWFNPAAHLAVSRLRAEQERACDDLVIESGTDARTYAHQLFDLAQTYRGASFPAWAAMSMARPSQLEGRVVAILDARRSRRVPSGSARIAAAAVAAAAVVPVGALQISAAGVDRDAVTAVEQSAPAIGAVAEAWARPVEPVVTSSSVASSDAGLAPAELDVPASSLGRLMDALPSFTFDVGELLASAPDFRVKADPREALPKDLIGSGWLKDRTDTREPLARGAAAQAPVSDDTRRRVADALIVALSDENADVREEALSALASMRDERAIPGLIKALGDPDADVRARALDTLVLFNTPAAADGVIAALKDRNADVRERAARHLNQLVSRGQVRDPKYLDVFAALLKDEVADVRRQAVFALGRLRDEKAVGPLTQALKDPAPDVREQAARALGQLRSADAVPGLIALLKDPAKDVREAAALSLGSIADPRAIDPLTAALKDVEPEVREQAARALGQIARGQRRGAFPGVPVVPPLPPLPPRAQIEFDPSEFQEIAERAQEEARRELERARRDLDRELRDLDRDLRDFDVPPPPPAPAPLPAPAPVLPRP